MEANDGKYGMALKAAKVLSLPAARWTIWITNLLDALKPPDYALVPPVIETQEVALMRKTTNNSLNVLALILLCNMKRTKEYVTKASIIKAYVVFGKEIEEHPMLAELGKTSLLNYTANIIMRCLESMWISRSLDELSMVYDTTIRGKGEHNTTKSKIYHVPPKMSRDEASNTYIINSSDLPKGNANNKNAPYALGVRNTPTPLSALAKLVEPNLIKNGANVMKSSKVHRLFILLKYDGLKVNNPKNNNPQRKTLQRLSTLVPSKGNSTKTENENNNRTVR